MSKQQDTFAYGFFSRFFFIEVLGVILAFSGGFQFGTVEFGIWMAVVSFVALIFGSMDGEDE
jgi:hypothetical protein